MLTNPVNNRLVLYIRVLTYNFIDDIKPYLILFISIFEKLSIVS